MPTNVEIPAALIDEFGDVVLLRDAFAPTERRYAQLREKLKDLLAEAGADEEFTPKGERFTLRISARSIERKVDLKAARRMLGATVFLQVCSVTIAALGNFLAKPQVEALLISERTGSRSYVPARLPESEKA